MITRRNHAHSCLLRVVSCSFVGSSFEPCLLIQVRTLVPLLPSGMEMEGDEIFKLTSKDGDMTIEKEKVPRARSIA